MEAISFFNFIFKKARPERKKKSEANSNENRVLSSMSSVREDHQGSWEASWASWLLWLLLILFSSFYN